jgi:hypothetical protein
MHLYYCINIISGPDGTSTQHEVDATKLLDEDQGDDLYAQDENQGDSLHVQHEDHGDHLHVQDEDQGENFTRQDEDHDSELPTGMNTPLIILNNLTNNMPYHIYF